MNSPAGRLLTVLIPCYNEAATIAEVVRRVRLAPLPAGWEKEIIVVDDGSKPETLSALNPLESEALVIYRSMNGGKGAAVKDGLAQARGEYIIIQDGDLELDPAQIQELLAPIIEGSADVTFGYRELAANDMPESKIVFYGGRLVSLLFNTAFLTNFRDVPCCYKLFPRTLVPALLACPSNDFVFDAVEMTRVISKGKHVVQVPVTYAPRSHAQGKKLNWQQGMYCALAVVLLRLGMHRQTVGQELLRMTRFLVSGGTTVLVSLTVLYALTEYAHVWYLVSSVIAFCVSYVVNFVLQKFWTFRSRDLASIKRQLPLHLSLGLTNLVFNTAMLYVFVQYGHLWYVAAQIVAAIVIAIENYFILSRFIFNK